MHHSCRDKQRFSPLKCEERKSLDENRVARNLVVKVAEAFQYPISDHGLLLPLHMRRSAKLARGNAEFASVLGRVVKRGRYGMF